MTALDEIRRVAAQTGHVERSRHGNKLPWSRKGIEATIAKAHAHSRIKHAKTNAENRWLGEHFDILPPDDTVPTAVAAKVTGLSLSSVRRHFAAASGGGAGNRCTYLVRDICKWLEERGP